MNTMKATEDQAKDLAPMLMELRSNLVKESATLRSVELKCQQINQVKQQCLQ